MYTKVMSELSTIHLPDGTIKVEKIVYKSDFEKIKKVLKSLSVAPVKTKTKDTSGEASKKPAHS